MNEHTGITETGTTSETLVMLFRRAVHLMTRAYHHHGHAHHTQAHVLHILEKKNPMNQRELMETLNIRSASLSEILGKLERNGFITRDRDEQDRRNHVITVTDQGAVAMMEYQKGRQESADALFSSLSDVERRQLGDILNKIIIDLEKNSSGDGSGDGHHGHDGGREHHPLHGHCGHGRHTRGHHEHNHQEYTDTTGHGHSNFPGHDPRHPDDE
jgi:DNA-binding MarR family transcriptional regulator